MIQSKEEFFDFHCHCLPGIDDGCQNCEESIQLLNQSASQGIQVIAATPHYYPTETVPQFLKRREYAAQALHNCLLSENMQSPTIVLGAEVAYHPGLIYEENLDRLCLGSSKFLLLELPFQEWGSQVVRDVQAMNSIRGITPILAHVERYFKIQNKRMMENMLHANVIVQMNAEYILGRWTRRKAKKMLKENTVQLLGSDSHNLTSRRPNLGHAMRILEKDGLRDVIEDINHLSRCIMHETGWKEL